MNKEPTNLEERIKYWDTCRDMDVPFWKRNRKYLAEVKQIQKRHLDPFMLADDKWIQGDWEKVWLPYIKYDRQFESNSLFDMIIYKLEVMRANFKWFCHHTDQAEVMQQLDEAIALGKKIQRVDDGSDDSPYDIFTKYSRKHCDNLAYVYKIGTKEKIATIKMPRNDAFNFEKIIRKNYVSPLDKYLKENNLKEFVDVEVAFGGKWHHFWQHRVWLHLCKKSNRLYKKDLKKFYKILADHMGEWWD